MWVAAAVSAAGDRCCRSGSPVSLLLFRCEFIDVLIKLLSSIADADALAADRSTAVVVATVVVAAA